MAAEVDRTAFHQLSYGLFLLSARHEGCDGACIINTAIQAASEPRMISICCIKGGCTQGMVEASGRFCVSVLAQECPPALFEHFGMQSGHDVDKFAGDVPARLARSEGGLLYEESANAFFDCVVRTSEDLGSHVLYVGEVDEARRLSDDPSITYAQYRELKRKAPAPQDSPGAAPIAWKCAICGYIYEGASLPEDFTCPLCGHGAEDFEPLYDNEREGMGLQEDSAAQDKRGAAMDKWVCTVCGYIYEGPEPPAECPVCHVPAEKFKKLEGEIKLAAEHKTGIYASTVKDNPDIDDETKQYIFDQLKANFDGECSEVGMYLCMARIAHREGYPEIGLYWEKAAYEEAEHAAKFAELLGTDLEPNMTDSTEKNLAWRVDCEYGATAGKFELASIAKKHNLDAIHDTVHEMARDEARHGKAFEGLLKRYFG